MDEELFDAAIQAWLDRAEVAEFQLYHDYYEGDHRLTFATTKFRQAFGGQFSEFAINLCPTVVDTLADRVQLEGFEVEPEEGEEVDIEREPDAIDKSLRSIWLFNSMERRQHEIHHEAFKCGESYAIVWPELVTGMPMIWPQEAAQMIVGHNIDNPDRLDWAMKIWQIPDPDLRVRVTFYTPEAIYKFISVDKVRDGKPRKGIGSYIRYQPVLRDGEPKEPWPIENPFLRVPVFPFYNNTGSELEGRSELKDIIPIQDAVNKTIMDMIVGQEYFALPQRWATGLETKQGPNGEVVSPFDIATGKLWTTAHEAVKFGQFQPADVGTLQDNADKLIEKISLIARIPLHYVKAISGDRWPSGESLKTAEGPFMSKVQDRMTIFGDPWSNVFSFALETMGIKEVNLQARWADPNPRAETEQFERFTSLVAQGVPMPIAGRIVKMDPKIVAMLEEAEAQKQAEAQAQQQQEIAAAQAVAETRQSQQQERPAEREQVSA
jgi:hypothetical protein